MRSRTWLTGSSPSGDDDRTSHALANDAGGLPSPLPAENFDSGNLRDRAFCHHSPGTVRVLGAAPLLVVRRFRRPLVLERVRRM